VNLMDESGKIIQTKTTDKLGHFSFENIPGDKNYSVGINEKDPLLKDNPKLFLLNQKEQIVKQIAKNGDYFIFSHLPADLNKLSAIGITDTTKLVAMKGKIVSSTNAGI